MVPMATTKSLEQIVLTRRRLCIHCGKLMRRGDVAIKYTVTRTGGIAYHHTAYWCDGCEKRIRRNPHEH